MEVWGGFVEGWWERVSNAANNTIIWAGTLLLLALMFRTSISHAIYRNGIKIKTPVFDVEIPRSVSVMDSVANERKHEGLGRKNSATDMARIAESAIRKHPEIVRSLVLWVDDHPSNNERERRAFEDLGIRFVSVRSTNEAIALLANSAFDLVISDMGRPEGEDAGLSLVNEVTERQPELPVILYTSQNGVKRASSVKGLQATAHPDELFAIVLSRLAAKGLRSASRS